MQRFFSMLIGSVFLGVLIGCSGFDSTQVLVHPDSVVTSGTFDVVLVNLYTYIDTAGSTISQDVTRDSLHVLVGLPRSWEVTEAKAAVVNDMTTNELLALQDSLVDEQVAAALLLKYESAAVAITADDGIAAALEGTEVTAHGGNGDVSVAVDDLEQRMGFSGSVNITISEGSTADTTLSVEAIIALLDSTGMVSDSTMEGMQSLLTFPGVSAPDSVGIVMVPVVVFLKLTAGEQVGNDTLYYFTKTGAMDQEPLPIINTLTFIPQAADAAQMISAMESGYMTYAPVSVVDASATTMFRERSSFSGATVSADRVSGSVRISPGTMADPATVVSVYSLRGTPVTILSPSRQLQAESIVWNGTDIYGMRVRAGTYIFRLENTTVTKEFTATLLR